MKQINEKAGMIIEHYNDYNEDERFDVKSKKIEFYTTMRYILKLAPKGAKILEIGAGAGAYSVELAKCGFDVTAVDLVERNVEIIKSKIKKKRLKNLTALQGDALDLNMFADCSFDVVLNLGPMYHLFKKAEKLKAINETLRVTKKNGLCMFAYITHSSIVWNYGVKKGNMNEIDENLSDKARLNDRPIDVFTAHHVEDFNALFKNTKTKHITNVATDGIAPLMSDYVDKMSNKDYQILLNWHYLTCERLDHQGLSSHMLYICKKL